MWWYNGKERAQCTKSNQREQTGEAASFTGTSYYHAIIYLWQRSLTVLIGTGTSGGAKTRDRRNHKLLSSTMMTAVAKVMLRTSTCRSIHRIYRAMVFWSLTPKLSNISKSRTLKWCPNSLQLMQTHRLTRQLKNTWPRNLSLRQAWLKLLDRNQCTLRTIWTQQIPWREESQRKRSQVAPSGTVTRLVCLLIHPWASQPCRLFRRVRAQHTDGAPHLSTHLVCCTHISSCTSHHMDHFTMDHSSSRFHTKPWMQPCLVVSGATRPLGKDRTLYLFFYCFFYNIKTSFRRVNFTLNTFFARSLRVLQSFKV